MFASSLKSRVRSKKLTFGPMMTFDFWPGYLEILKANGMHFVVLDMEHGSASLQQAEELCRTARLLDLPLLLRPETIQYHVVKKYLDMGPAGLMLPWTERQEQMDALREALFVPPKGRRGPGGPSILANRSLDRAGWDEIEAGFFVMIQIETAMGLDNLSSLAKPDWVDAVMPGPYDLSLNLGPCGEMDHPDMVAALHRMQQESAKLGKSWGMVVNSLDLARAWIEFGCRLFILSEVSVMVRQYSRHLADAVRAMVPESDR